MLKITLKKIFLPKALIGRSQFKSKTVHSRRADEDLQSTPPSYSANDERANIVRLQHNFFNSVRQSLISFVKFAQPSLPQTCRVFDHSVFVVWPYQHQRQPNVISLRNERAWMQTWQHAAVTPRLCASEKVFFTRIADAGLCVFCGGVLDSWDANGEASGDQYLVYRRRHLTRCPLARDVDNIVVGDQDELPVPREEDPRHEPYEHHNELHVSHHI